MDRLQVNDALEHAHTTIEAVSAHLSERHSTKLELIIIWLIVVEVVLAGAEHVPHEWLPWAASER